MDTTQDPTIREDLISVLKDVSPLGGNYLVGNLGTSKATSTLHQWAVYNQTRPTSITFTIEGADPTYVDLTARARSVNATAIISDPVLVTETQNAVNTVIGGDEWTFQKRKALLRMNAKMEFALMNGAFASGSSGVARGMAGLAGVISTNLTARDSGSSISVTEIEDILQNSWDQVGSEYVADTILCTMKCKRAISGLTTNVTNYVNETDKLYRNISVYEASTGVVTIVPHKDVYNTAGSVALYAIRKELYKVAYLREPKFEEYAKTGDSRKGQYLTEMTLESLAQRASCRRTGYDTNGIT